jgi:hypothetical protein
MFLTHPRDPLIDPTVRYVYCHVVYYSCHIAPQSIAYIIGDKPNSSAPDLTSSEGELGSGSTKVGVVSYSDFFMPDKQCGRLLTIMVV